MTNENPLFPGQEDPVLPKHGLMEELNIPPQIIQFVRQNAKNIQICLGAIVVIVVLVMGVDAYHDSVRAKSNALLFKSMQTEDIEIRNSQLQQVFEQYPGSDAAIWAQLELAHHLRDTGNTDEAIERYQAVANELSSNSPLMPLVLLAKGQIFETTDKLDEALSMYTELATMTGFSYIGNAGKARVYELQENPQAALAIFNELKNDVTLSPQLREWLGVKGALITEAEPVVESEAEIVPEEK